jgi:hypothetical protein
MGIRYARFDGREQIAVIGAVEGAKREEIGDGINNELSFRRTRLWHAHIHRQLCR